MDNYDALRESVTMQAVVEKYMPTVRIRQQRIPCPFHGGEHANLAFTDRVWYCHVCHAGGDVIEFVRRFFHLRFPETVLRLSADFGVPVGGRRATASYVAKRERELQAILKRRQEAADFSDKQIGALSRLRRWLWDNVGEDAQSVIDDIDALLDRHQQRQDLFTWDAGPMIDAIYKQYEVYNDNDNGDAT